jgi:ubiquinone/menaquinone biosynthesis C-methylase UbiE
MRDKTVDLEMGPKGVWVFSFVKNDSIRGILDHPMLFNLARDILAGSQSQTHRIIAEQINQNPHGAVLDIGCGTGDFAHEVAGLYVGIDLKESFVRFAANRNNQNGSRFFFLADALQCPFAPKSFTITLLLNCLHHLPDADVLAVLGEANRLTRERILIVDMQADTDNRIRRFFNSLDRGDYVRSFEQQRRLVESLLQIDKTSVYNSRAAPQVFFLCAPKESDR